MVFLFCLTGNSDWYDSHFQNCLCILYVTILQLVFTAYTVVHYTIPMCHVRPGNWEDCTFLELAQWHDGIGAVSPVAIELHQDTRRRRKSAVCRYAEEPQAEVDGGCLGKA